jgi:hypothetical protein
MSIRPCGLISLAKPISHPASSQDGQGGANALVHAFRIAGRYPRQGRQLIADGIRDAEARSENRPCTPSRARRSERQTGISPALDLGQSARGHDTVHVALLFDGKARIDHRLFNNRITIYLAGKIQVSEMELKMDVRVAVLKRVSEPANRSSSRIAPQSS